VNKVNPTCLFVSSTQKGSSYGKAREQLCSLSFQHSAGGSGSLYSDSIKTLPTETTLCTQAKKLSIISIDGEERNTPKLT
jgi:hypothetical protein